MTGNRLDVCLSNLSNDPGYLPGYLDRLCVCLNSLLGCLNSLSHNVDRYYGPRLSILISRLSVSIPEWSA